MCTDRENSVVFDGIRREHDHGRKLSPTKWSNPPHDSPNPLRHYQYTPKSVAPIQKQGFFALDEKGGANIRVLTELAPECMPLSSPGDVRRAQPST